MLIINIATLSVYACVVLEIILGDGGVESVEALHLEGAPSSAALLFSFLFLDFSLSSQTHKKKGIKFALQNSLMHDADEHYFHVRQPHDRRMEYV